MHPKPSFRGVKDANRSGDVANSSNFQGERQAIEDENARDAGRQRAARRRF
jgi:hypothetical protein